MFDTIEEKKKSSISGIFPFQGQHLGGSTRIDIKHFT